MKKLNEYSHDELEALQSEYRAKFEAHKAKGLKLDMSRGKPSKLQLDLSNELFDLPVKGDVMMDGIDARNYGTLDGLPSCRAYFADVLGCDKSEVFAAGSSSLSLMYDLIAKAYTHGLMLSEKPWSKLDKVKFICPAPGYDRHFAICETFDMDMITVTTDDNGPDMDVIENLVKDESVKGIWIVPKYSNPEGIIYSREVLDRLASLKPAAKDFVIMCDNAYIVHEFDGEYVEFPDMLALCREKGNPHMVFEFASTSKITFPGAGISCFACSTENMAYMKKLLTVQTISYDKINQLRHVQFLKDKAHTIEHMKKHAAIMKPKFELVLNVLDTRVDPFGFAYYHRPKGGYFISLDTMPGCAKRTHALMKEVGVVMTGPGATFPYGKDPEDRNLRIAPSFPPIAELEQAADVLADCLVLAAVEKLLGL